MMISTRSNELPAELLKRREEQRKLTEEIFEKLNQSILYPELEKNEINNGKLFIYDDEV